MLCQLLKKVLNVRYMTWVSSFAHSARRRQGGRQERHGFSGIYVNA
jgi:hypothetical protein